MSVDNAHEGYIAGQGYGADTHPSPLQWSVSLLLPSIAMALIVSRAAETQLGIWRQSCDQLVVLLHDYSQTLLSNLQRFQKLGDKSGAEAIRSCCVNCLAHLAALYEALSDIGPTPQTGMDALCDSSLARLGRLAEDMCVEEYTRHDLLLGVRCVQQRPAKPLIANIP